MKGIHVDPATRTARAQGGVLWKEFNRETQLHGLATTGGVVGGTGIAGLTLGGGLGWLMPKYGLALDNLRSRRTRAGRRPVVRASADENPDLFWAIRGGGGNFGIATSLEYDVHPVGPMITGGVVAHPLARRARRARLLSRGLRRRTGRDDARRGLQTAPDGSGAKIVGIIARHIAVRCRRAKRPSRKSRPSAADHGSHRSDAVHARSTACSIPAFPKGALNYWKSQLLAELSDERFGR